MIGLGSDKKNEKIGEPGEPGDSGRQGEPADQGEALAMSLDFN